MGPYLSSERGIKFRRCLFTFSVKREIRHFHVVVVQTRRKNVQKGVTHLQIHCFAYKLFVFVTLSLLSRRWILK